MLLSPEQITAFLLTAFLVTLAPGPDNLMVLGTGISRGRRAGMMFGFGCAVGCLSHTLLAAVGVSALIAASPLAFTILKIIGGAYLVWLGIGALRSSGTAAPGQAQKAASSWRLFGRGLFANAINPKVVLFFLAFLPQFVDTARGHSGWQIVQLGVLMTLMTALIFGAIGYFSGSVGLWLQRRPKAGLWLDRIAGGLFVGLGLKLIVSR